MGKGFGKTTSTGKAKQFFDAFQKRCIGNSGDSAKIHEFFKARLVDLDEFLLEAMPQLLQQLTEHQAPEKREQVAVGFGNFGAGIQDFPLGNRQINLELSIQAAQLALKVFSRRLFPKDWARTQNNLGTAYATRIRGERADNLEAAIQAFNLALEVRTRDALLEDWAATQNNLGAAYATRICGERADNLEAAIHAYKLALEVYTRNAFSEEWAMTQNNLGSAYGHRIYGERTDNLEAAVHAYKLALEVRTCDAFPKKWAETQNNLGLAYCDRIQGERADNLEAAIHAYNLALEVSTRDALPENWAVTQNNLGNAYRDRIKGDRADNLETAIRAHQQAAEVFTREAFPLKYAESQGNLAETILQRALLTENPADLDTAIEILQSALEIDIPGTPNFIDCQYRLGNALSHRYEQSQRPTDLQAAIQTYKIALDAISPEHYDRHKIWQALPTTQAILGSRLVREGEWQEGLQLLLNSLTQLRSINHRDDRIAYANALFHTGRAYESLTDWDKARLYYRDAIRYYESLDDPFGMAKSYEGLGGVLISQGHLEKGSIHLQTAQTLYQRLPKVADKAENVYNLLEIAQRAIDRQLIEIPA
jgi:tetratricopeptide (TPR) repeat protein